MMFSKFQDGIANNAMSEADFLAKEIERWLVSSKRLSQIAAERYYRGDHDIVYAKRQVLNSDGELEDVKYLPNNRIVYNQFAKLVDQKVNYLLSRPITFETDNKKLKKSLDKMLNNRFRRLLKNAGKESISAGLSWLYVYYDGGKMRFQKFKSYEVLPFWNDDEHTDLHSAVRLTISEVYEGQKLIKVMRADYYAKDGVTHYFYKDGKLTLDLANPRESYLKQGDDEYTFERLPLIAFKANGDEIALIDRVKSMQDAINTMLSNFTNNMQEDPRNTILVVVNYGGADPEALRNEIAQYGVIHVTSHEGVAGDVKTLTIEVNAENYKTIVKILKDAITEIGRGFDAKDDRLSNNPNQMNIQSMYADMDLDAGDMELEYQAAFEELFEFLFAYLL